MAPSLALFFSIQETDQTRTGGWDPSREPAGFATPTSIAATWQRPQFASTQFVLRIGSTVTDGPVEAPDSQHSQRARGAADRHPAPARLSPPYFTDERTGSTRDLITSTTGSSDSSGAETPVHSPGSPHPPDRNSWLHTSYKDFCNRRRFELTRDRGNLKQIPFERDQNKHSQSGILVMSDEVTPIDCKLVQTLAVQIHLSKIRQTLPSLIKSEKI